MPSSDRLLPRRRLVARVAIGLGRTVVLVHGEAGSGKSTLIRLLAREAGRRVVIVTLDERAQDASFLAGTIGEAIGATDPPTSGPESATEKLAWLLRAMADAGPLVLALDDVHRLGESPSALRMLARLARERPPGVGLVIVSRGQLQIPGPDQEVTEIASEDLAL